MTKWGWGPLFCTPNIPEWKVETQAAAPWRRGSALRKSVMPNGRGAHSGPSACSGPGSATDFLQFLCLDLDLSHAEWKEFEFEMIFLGS